MKKRLLSMLMAVLMIASLVPATALAAGDVDPHATHDVLSVNIEKDAAAKQPGIMFEYCNTCSYAKDKDVVIKSLVVTPFADAKDICVRHDNLKTVVLQAATCEKPAISVTYCVDCGQAVPALGETTSLIIDWSKSTGHSYSEFHVSNEPTCTADGWGYTVCDNCGEPVFVYGAGTVNADDSYPVGTALYYLTLNKEKNEVKTATKESVAAMFAATNPGHEKNDKLVTPAEDVYGYTWVADPTTDYETGYLKKTLLYKAAVKPTHGITVNGTPVVKAEGVDVVPFDEVSNTNYVYYWLSYAGYTGDYYCPVCNDYVDRGEDLPALNVDPVHAMSFIQAGYLPYLDSQNHKINGVSDVWNCTECGKLGGTAIAYDSWFVKEYASYETLVSFENFCKSYYGVTTNTYGYLENESVLVGAIDAGCLTKGYTGDTYTVVAGEWVMTKKGTDTAALGHDLVKVDSKAPTCTEIGWTCSNYYVCDRCDYHTGTCVLAATKAEHSWQANVLVAPTCKNTGLTVVSCAYCNAVAVLEDEDIADSYRAYDADEDSYYDIYVDLVKKAPHTAGDPVNVKEATCTEVGYTGDTFCKFCGVQMSTGKEVPMKEHTSADVEAVDPTCTEAGSKAGTKCSVCGEVLSGCEEVPALGHQTEVKDAKEASCTEAGYTGDTVCTVCGEEVKGEEIPALGHKFANGICTVCGVKDPTFNPFPDVAESSPYYEAILWAYNNDITTGKLDGTFGVNDGCTRAQIVTFLYRQAGSPEVSADVVNPFTDVSADSVYYKAIMWAVSEGITKGTTATTFDPNAVCTRGQIVTFLFRASGDEKVATTVSFSDVAEGSYCYDAVAWAVANGVTKGFSDTTFAPNATCTRGQAVTFIYRANAE